MKRKEVPVSLSAFDEPSLPGLSVQAMLRTLKRASKDKVNIDDLWKQNEQWLEGLGQKPSDYKAKKSFCSLVKQRYRLAIDPSRGTFA